MPRTQGLSLLLLAPLALATSPAAGSTTSVQVPGTSSAKNIGFSAFLSLSIELGSFPLFAGNLSSPNEFSSNLLQNLGNFQGGYMPVLRVGGNSQDRAIYDPSIDEGATTSCPIDPAAVQCIGTSFFESYSIFPNTYYSHGFNLALISNQSGYDTLAATVPLACKAIGSQLEVWEYGNEPDLFRGKSRPSDWTVQQYIEEWLNGTALIKQYLAAACPELGAPKFMAPSFSSPGSAFSQVTAFQAGGVDSQNAVAQKSLHNYITGATSPGVTLQGTLMNHNVTKASLQKHVTAANNLAAIDPNPYIVGECNSLYGGGAAGLSDVFGAALWVVDFTLYAASTGVIERVHYHQSNGAPYSAWSFGTSPATMTPYYGKLAASKFLGASNATSVSEIPLGSSAYQSAYAAYAGGQLDRVAVLNMYQFNSTSTTARPSNLYSFSVGAALAGSKWQVERLTAPGSDVKTNVTFGGYAYEYSSLGKGVRPSGRGSCQDRTIQVGNDGVLSVSVQNSEAVVLSLVK